MENTYNDMQRVKRRFFAMRNGVVADALRKAGSPFRFIFGMNLPQLVETVDILGGPNEGLARQLWANNATRESMLLAPMLMPVDAFTHYDALQWTSLIPAAEVADVLCHRLLRYEPYAWDLAEQLSESATTNMEVYTALRLALNIVRTDPPRARVLAQRHMPHPLAVQLNDECDFLME